MNDSGGKNKNNETAPNPLEKYAYENNYDRLPKDDPYNPANRANFAQYENVPVQQTPPSFASNNAFQQQNPQSINQMPQMQPAPQMAQQQSMQQTQQMRPTPMMPAPQPTAAPAQKKGHALEIALIVFIFLIGAGAIAGAAYCQSQFSTLNANVMTDRSKRVDDAKAAQKILDDQAYENRNASNTKEFTGPSDFGAITFKYPKSWKVYLENNDDSNPTYAAYFSPEYVPPTSGGYSFALSFKIVNQEYNKYLQTLNQRKLISTQPWNNPNNTLTGSKITGKLDEKAEQPNGSEIVIRVNNYTAIVRTDDYDKYGEDFDEILATLDSANSANSTKGTSDTNDTDQ